MADTKQLGGDSGLEVRVVTPVGTVAHTNTDAVTAPGRLGEFEILPGHVPFLTELHPGVLVLGEKTREYFAVASGYLKVGNDGVIEILVEKAVAGSKVDAKAADAELSELKPKIDGWSEPLGAEYRTLSDSVRWAEAQLAAHRNAGN